MTSLEVGMSSDLAFEEKGKARPKPAKNKREPQKESDRPPHPSRLGELDTGTLTQMQQTVGNTAVQRFLVRRSESGPTEIEEETAAAINAERGGGQALDENVAARASRVTGEDLSEVKVHSDSQADRLSRQLGATAFTTGNDIFFRAGAYNPAEGDSQRLIAHELTHVVQQGASTPALQGKMTVNDPDDQFEVEADAVADRVMNPAGNDALQRQEIPQEEELLQMQEMDEEEEVV